MTGCYRRSHVSQRGDRVLFCVAPRRRLLVFPLYHGDLPLIVLFLRRVRDFSTLVAFELFTKRCSATDALASELLTAGADGKRRSEVCCCSSQSFLFSCGRVRKFRISFFRKRDVCACVHVYAAAAIVVVVIIVVHELSVSLPTT